MAVKSLLKLWTLFYIYSLGMGLLVQKFILSVVFPQAHWGKGLMVGGDWISFYKNAVIVADNIKKYGWSVWSLHPSIDGQIMTGITSFFFVISGIYEPWILLFYNSFLHATAGIVLILILIEYGVDKKIAVICSLPLIFFPSSLTWVSQIHRDALYILGFLMIFYSITLLDSDKLRKIVLSTFAGVSGILLVCLARSHMLIPLKYIFLITSFSFFIVFFYKFFKERRLYLNTVYKALLLLFLVIVISNIYTTTTISNIYTTTTISNIYTTTTTTTTTTYYWVKDWWVPKSIDDLFYNLAYTRYHLVENVLKGSASAIDLDFIPHKVSDFILYTPRALVIGFFSPFPDLWFNKGSTAGGTIARCIAPFETMMLWFALIVFPLSFLRYGKKFSFYVILFLITIFVWLHVISEPNIGTIYRKRYVFIHVLMAFSFSSFFCFIKSKIETHEKVKKII